MSSRLDRHKCASCGRSRSKEFHRKYPAGPGYPDIHSICRRCRPGGLRRSRSHESLRSEARPSKDGVSRVVQALLRTMSNCGTRVIDGMTDRQDVHVHVHHHHWHQNENSEPELRNPSISTSRSTLSRRNTLQSEVAELPGGDRYFEMPYSPRHPPTELPAYHVATGEQPPPVPPKPIYYDHQNYNYAI